MLEKRAESACRAAGRGVRPQRAERECREELLNALIKATNSDVLTRIHSGTDEIRVAQQ
jgi:hypothetical protein